MIRALIATLTARGDELAELRDRAVRDAAAIDRLRGDNLALAAQLAHHDQTHAQLVETTLHVYAHARHGCPSCRALLTRLADARR